MVENNQAEKNKKRKRDFPFWSDEKIIYKFKQGMGISKISFEKNGFSEDFGCFAT